MTALNHLFYNKFYAVLHQKCSSVGKLPMKSIMQEASSISKAIDLAWNRAGKPAQFSIKILEEPERNMFGLVKKSAKIAFFFDEKAIIVTPQAKPAPAAVPVPEKVKAPAPKEEPLIVKNNDSQPRRPRSAWTDELAKEASDWIRNILDLAHLPTITYSITHNGNVLKCLFESSPTGSTGTDRILYSSFAHLMLTTLRHRHKRQFRHLKVILSTR